MSCCDVAAETNADSDVDRRCAVLGHCDMQWSLRAVGNDWG
jgi:hypothetical protein